VGEEAASRGSYRLRRARAFRTPAASRHGSPGGSSSEDVLRPLAVPESRGRWGSAVTRQT
jgi:hypothetical protein